MKRGMQYKQTIGCRRYSAKGWNGGKTNNLYLDFIRRKIVIKISEFAPIQGICFITGIRTRIENNDMNIIVCTKADQFIEIKRCNALFSIQAVGCYVLQINVALRYFKFTKMLLNFSSIKNA